MRLTLQIVGLLQFAVASDRRIRACGRIERPLRKLCFGARDLRVKTGELQVQGGNIRTREGRVQGRQDLAGLDPLTLVHLERLDDRRIKRLDDDRRLHGNDLALAGDNAVELGEARCGEQAYDHRRQDPQCRAHASRLRGREDLGSL